MGKHEIQVGKVILFGCGGHARSIINVLRENEKVEQILLVDKKAHKEEIIMGCKVVNEYTLQPDDGYIIAVGDNLKRSWLFQTLRNGQRGYPISPISEHAHIAVGGQIGNGTFVAPNAYVGPMARIGDNTIINTGSVIEHETIIGNNTHIAPNTTVCGRVNIGNNVFCGAGSTVIDKINICDNVIIGAGAVINRDIVEAGTYVGVPARKIR